MFGGGTIPEKDIPGLMAMGIKAVFTPGTAAETILKTLDDCLKEQSGAAVS